MQAQKMIKVMIDGREVAEVPEENLHNVRAMYERKGMATQVSFFDPSAMENLKKQQEALRNGFEIKQKK